MVIKMMKMKNEQIISHVSQLLSENVYYPN